MRPFKNKGWEHYDAIQAIMFSTAARGSHIYRPAQASHVVTTTIDEADDMVSETLITPHSNSVANKPAGTHASAAAAAAITSATAASGSGIVESAVSMDIDHVPPPSLSANSAGSKRLHSVMSLNSDEIFQMASTSITTWTPTPSAIDLPIPPMKQQKGLGASGVTRDSQRTKDSKGNARATKSLPEKVLSFKGSQPEPHAQSSRTGRVSQAVAMVGMQSQIGRLTDVFEKAMVTPEDATSGQRSLALTRLQEQDDGLSMNEKVKLISIFQKDISYVQTYLDLVVDEIRQAWLRSILDDV
jgi:hypothetical protein